MRRRLLCTFLAAIFLCSCAAPQEDVINTNTFGTLPFETDAETDQTEATESATESATVATEAPGKQILIASQEELAALAKSDTLESGSTIRLTADMQITEPIVFTVPVCFRAEAAVVCQYPVYVETMQPGTIYIEASDDGAYLDFRIDAPNCDVWWPTQNIGEEAAAQCLNVRTFNGVDLTEKYGLGGAGTVRLLSVSMEPEENGDLDAGLEWYADGNTFYLAVSYLVDDRALENAAVRLETDNGETVCIQMDLTQEQHYTTADNEGGHRTYKIVTERITYNLPVVYIEIEDAQEVTSREEYLQATVRIDTTNAAGDFPELETISVLIRGRGHYSWKFDKTPYKLRFDKKTSVLGLNASKNWVLLANYADRSLIQNYVAMEMGKVMTNLPYHSTQYPVDVFVNGSYRGVYTMGEQLEAKEERIDLEESYEEVDTDYLLEIGGYDEGNLYGRDYFHTGTLNFVAIKHPDSSQLTQQQLDYLIDYVSAADRAVRTLNNYEDYIDVDSLIDWLILHELTYNLDSCFRRSCYMIKEKGGKLVMGPIWDFDLAFGSFYRYEEGDWASIGAEGEYVGVTWINYLKEDEAFMARLTARWNEIKEPLLLQALSSVDEMAALVAPSAQMNFEVWDILGKSVPSQPSSHKQYDTYDKMIGRLRTFLQDRSHWLDQELNG